MQIIGYLLMLISAVVLVILFALDYQTALGFLISLSRDKTVSSFSPQIFLIAKAIAFFSLFIPGILLVVFQKPISNFLALLTKEAKEEFQYFIKKVKKTNVTNNTVFFVCLLLVFLVFFITNLFFINQPIKYDEAQSFLSYSSNPLYIIVSKYYPNNHVFHNILVHPFYLALGLKEWVLRIPVLIFGSFLVVLVFLLAKRLFDKQVAYLSAVFVASSFHIIDYATNARGYIMIAVFTIVLIICLLKLIEHKSPFYSALFVLASTLGFYTNPTFLYPFFGLNLWFFWRATFAAGEGNKPRLLREFFTLNTVTAVLTLLVYFPIILGSGIKELVANDVVKTYPNWDSFFADFSLMLVQLYDRWFFMYPSLLKPVVLVCFFLGAFLPTQPKKVRFSLLLALVIGILLINFGKRVVGFPRVYLYFYPVFLIYASAGICHLLKSIRNLKVGMYRPSFLYLAGLLLVLLQNGRMVMGKHVIYSNETGTFIDAKSHALYYADYLESQGKLLCFTTADLPLLYYFKKYNLNQDNLIRPPKYIIGSDLPENQIVVGKFFVSIDHFNNQNLEDILRQYDLLNEIDRGSIKLVKEFPFSSLYMVDMKNESVAYKVTLSVLHKD
jgi:4-amino-4-deoxy-L-arabinose transferase-like glycosyltransferase